MDVSIEGHDDGDDDDIAGVVVVEVMLILLIGRKDNLRSGLMIMFHY
jgi:hypothetical protein